jgi:L-amino acid N-acyltransferase YncA
VRRAIDKIVRDAEDSDLTAIQRIYAFYVLNGLATFEETPPTTEEIRKRRLTILQSGLPYLVATLDDEVAGYAYATMYRPRAAYRYTVENSVYVAEGLRAQGIGTVLLAALIARCELGGWRQMIAVIGDSDNAASIALHGRMGFELTGTLKAVGFKFGRWVDTVIMQRALGAGARTLPDSR